MKKMKKVLKIAAIMLAVLIVIAGCGFAYLYFSGMSGMANTTQAEEGQIKVACVGDSITYGHGISGWPENNYPAVLQGLLGETYHVNSYGDAQIILCTPATAFFLEGQTEGLTQYDIQPLVVDEIAQIVRGVAQEQGYTLLDIHELTAQYPEWFSKDGVHPSNEGAAAIAKAVQTAITENP